MPTLRHEDNPEEGVQFLERWYNAALTSRYPKAHTMRVAKAGGTRPYWELALAECLKHNIRPGAWVAFSIDEWRVTSPQRALKSPPDVKFIFGPRMQSRLWVYRDVEAEYAPSRKMYTPDARSVLDRLHLVKAFATSVGWDEPKIQAEVARQFPKGFQQETLAAARTTKATNAALQQQLRAGKWLWTKDYDGKKARALAARRPSMEEGTHG
jgi:hypothetical protein